MAGIGFTLRRMLSERNLGGPLKALTFATVIAAGPWITSSASLGILGVFSALGTTSADYRVFLALVSYVFGFSLIGVGATQMVASRFLADQLFENRPEAFAPAFAQLIVPLLGFQALAGAVFLTFVPISTPAKIATLVLYLAVNGSWLAMAFLSAAKDYRTILVAFLAGWALSTAAGLSFGAWWGLAGQVAGFAAGYVLVFFALLWRVRVEFGLPDAPEPGLWRYFREFWPLAVAGLAYNLGLWVDKLIFWHHPEAGERVAGLLYAAPLYDNAMFLAYVSVVPALGLFLLRVETDFYDSYRDYFATIASHARYAEILAAKTRMVAVLKDNLWLLLKVQAPITLGVILFAPEIMSMLAASWLSLFSFRFGVLGALLHALHLSVMILLLYLDFRKRAMALALTFLGTNALFTLGAFAGGFPAYGFGYAASCGVTLMVGALMLGHAVRDLEGHVFMRQPLS